MGRQVILEDTGRSYENANFHWDKITHSLNPETEDLPKGDREYFESKVKLLIGKEIRLSNIAEKHLYIYIRRGDLIFKSMRYPMLFPEEFIRAEIGKLLYRLGIPISKEGLGWKFGPMGFQQQHIKQEVIGVPSSSVQTSGR